MEIKDHYKKSLAIINDAVLISDQIYKKLIENSFSFLASGNEIHSLHSLYNSKPDVIKEVYAALLYLCTELVRNNISISDAQQFLLNNLNFSISRTEMLIELYKKHKLTIQGVLINIGNHLPHITDVKWKIDYIAMSNTLSDSEGPLFRISLVTEKFDEVSQSKVVDNVNFNCTSLELQDFVYKLKDAVRHCQKLSTMDH